MVVACFPVLETVPLVCVNLGYTFILKLQVPSPSQGTVGVPQVYSMARNCIRTWRALSPPSNLPSSQLRSFNYGKSEPDKDNSNRHANVDGEKPVLSHSIQRTVGIE